MKKKKIDGKRISRAQTGMRALGVFHYALAGFLLLMIILLIVAGPEQLGEAVHQRNDSSLSVLNQYDDEVAGVTVIGLLIIQFGIELYLGWSTRRKALRPDKMLLKLILSGGSVLMTLFSLLRSAFTGAEVAGVLYTLILNLTTFLLALRIKLVYERLRGGAGEGPKAQAGDGS